MIARRRCVELAQFDDEAVTSVDDIVQCQMLLRPALTRHHHCVRWLGDLQFMSSNVFAEHLHGYLRESAVLLYEVCEVAQLFT